MRPIHLQLSGFGAFREATDIDFSDVDYLALVGPTGSGKSTVIDAMCFALYGTVPRYGHERRVGYVVTAGALEAKVSFTFEAGGARYVATRVVRRRPDGKAQTKEARLEVMGPEGSQVLAGSVAELDAAITGPVLGMPFSHFTRCVVLPQGEFARFLLDQPRDRQEMLVELLGLEVYARMAQRASQLKTNREWQAGQLRARIDSLAAATPAAIEAAGERLVVLEKVAGQLGAARGELEVLSGQEHQARQRAEQATADARLLEAVVVPADAETAGRRLRQAREARQSAEEDWKARRAELGAAEAAVAALGDRSPIDAALLRHRQLADLAAQSAAAGARLAEATRAAEAASQQAEEADAELGRAEARDRAVRAERAAHALADRLVVGDPCPVCLVEVAALPDHPPTPDLAEARAALEAARETAAAARRAATETAGKREAAATLLADFRRREADLQAELGDAPGEEELRRRLGDIEAAVAHLAQTRQAEQQARARHEEATAACAAAETAVAGLQRAFDAARDPLAALGAPAAGRVDVAEDWAALARWAAARAGSEREAEREARADVDRFGRAAERALEVALAAGADAGLPEPPSPRDPPGRRLEALERACVAAEAETRAELARLQEALADATRLQEEAKAADDDATVARALARHLSAKGFERWLLAEVLAGLVARASEILREVSSGAYSLAVEDDGDFFVVDHRNADERRSAKTLSGGETFQASLALALSLAEQLSSLATAGAARIEATFIDEGFGSLDADTLDTVAATLENLVADDRLVGIVTHVRELAERVPVRIEMTKGPRTATATKVVA